MSWMHLLRLRLLLVAALLIIGRVRGRIEQKSKYEGDYGRKKTIQISLWKEKNYSNFTIEKTTNKKGLDNRQRFFFYSMH